MAVLIGATALVGLLSLFGIVSPPVVALLSLVASAFGGVGWVVSYFMKDEGESNESGRKES
jgi:hypothetical protein